MWRAQLWIMAAIALVLLSACADHSQDHPEHTPLPVASPTPPTSAPEALAPIQRQYERLVASHQAIAPIWEALGTGEQAQCSQPVESVPPESITLANEPPLQEITVLLRQAALDLDQAVTLWRAECNHPRPTVPPDVIDRGRLAARAAGDALRQANALLQQLTS